MNKDIVEGNWHELKGKIKQQWAKLTDDDIAHAKGSFEELAGKIQTAYGSQKDQVKKEIDAFIDKNQ